MNRIQNPITSDVVDYNLIEFIMRIDQNSGEVVWAKSYAFQSISFALVYNHMKIINQVIWTLKTINDQDFARGLITKLDENGDVLENFVILDVMTKNISYLFSPSFLIPFNDGFVISSWTSYYGSGLGVSLISSLDRTLIKFDSQRNIDWITSFDFDNQIDNTSNMELFDNTIYLAWPIGLGDHYYWISTVYLTTGEVIIIKCYFRDSSSTTNNRKIKTFIFLN